MSYIRITTVCWMPFLAGLGTLLILFLSMLNFGLPKHWFTPDLQLLVVSIVLIAGPAVLLGWRYRVKSPEFPGYWHLSLADLLTATFLTALMMSAYRALWPASFLSVGVFASLVQGIGFVCCQLLATRKGCVATRLKTIGALGYFLTAAAGMSTGFYFTWTTFAGLGHGMGFFCQAARELIGTPNPDGAHSDAWLKFTLPIGLALFPVGYLVRKYVERQLASGKSRMSYARHKTVSWVLLFAGVGTTLAFLIIALDEGFLKRWSSFELCMFIGSLTLAAISGAALVYLYRAEPANFAGFWHLSLADLLTATFFTALMMTAFRAIWPENFFPIGVFVTLLLGLGFVFSLLLAARKGCAEMRLKIIGALGYFLSALGWMSTGFLLLLGVWIVVFEGERWKYLGELFGELLWLTAPLIDVPWLMNVFRIGIVLLPVSYGMRKFVERELARAKSVAPEKAP